MPAWSDPLEIVKEAGGGCPSAFSFRRRFLTSLCFPLAFARLRVSATVALIAHHSNTAGIFQKLCLVMLGLSSWEIITQLAFDWSVISRKVLLGLLFHSSNK
jgi:hypothetical protein